MTETADMSARNATESILRFATDNILTKYGKTQVSKAVWDMFGNRNQQRSVVVVGEVDRGKSALVNALAGVMDASPSGVNFTTRTPIGVGETPEKIPSGQAQIIFPDRVENISHQNLHTWVASHTTNTSQEVPTRAFVPVESCMVDAVIIDTPGVGGLNPDHANIALDTTRQACVIVVACDASTPITAPEMAFISQAAENTDHVIVAVTKIDKHLTGFSQIVDNNRDLLREHIGREIPVVGVSSLLAVFEDESESAEFVERMRRSSGIDELRRLIADRFDSAENIPIINATRIAVGGLAELRADLQRKLQALTDADTSLPELEHQLAELNRLKQETERWEQYLNRDITHIRQRAREQLDVELAAIKTKWTELIRKQGMTVLRQNPQFFTAQIEQDLHKAVTQTLDKFGDDLRTRIIAPRFGAKDVWDEIATEVASAFTDRQLHTGEVRKKTDGVFDPMMLIMGISGGSLIGGALLGAASFTGVGAVIGAGWVAFNAGFRAMRSGKQNLLQWINEANQQTKVFTTRLIEAAVANARPAIIIRYREYLKEQTAQVQAHIKTAQSAAQLEEQQRTTNIDRLNKNITIIDKNITRCETAIDLLRQQSNPTQMVVNS